MAFCFLRLPLVILAEVYLHILQYWAKSTVAVIEVDSLEENGNDIRKRLLRLEVLLGLMVKGMQLTLKLQKNFAASLPEHVTGTLPPPPPGQREHQNTLVETVNNVAHHC